MLRAWCWVRVLGAAVLVLGAAVLVLGAAVLVLVRRTEPGSEIESLLKKRSARQGPTCVAPKHEHGGTKHPHRARST